MLWIPALAHGLIGGPLHISPEHALDQPLPGRNAMMLPSRRSVLAGMAGLAAAPFARAWAQAYPDRPINLIVPFAAGGSTDILARIVGEHLRQSLKQPIVIENRTGASGNIGTAAAARALPDGYTLLF